MSKSLGNVIRPLEMKAALRHGRVPLLPAARDGVRPGRDVQRGRLRHPHQRRSRQRPRQPGRAGRWPCSSATSPAWCSRSAPRGRRRPRAGERVRDGARRARRRTSSSSRSTAPSRRCGAPSITRTSTSSPPRRSRWRRIRRPSRAPAPCCTTCSRPCSSRRVLLRPFLPETARRLFGLLALPEERLGDLDLPWGQAFAPGHRTAAPEALFPRIEVAPA